MKTVPGAWPIDEFHGAEVSARFKFIRAARWSGSSVMAFQKCSMPSSSRPSCASRIPRLLWASAHVGRSVKAARGWSIMEGEILTEELASFMEAGHDRLLSDIESNRDILESAVKRARLL